MSHRIRLDGLLVDGEAAAFAVLRALGATPVPMLTLPGTLPDAAPFVRRFGVVLGLPAGGPVRSAWDAVVDHPTNARVRAALAGPAQRHLPASRWIAEELSRTALPAHLPWALRPLSMDLATAVEEWADAARPSFTTWFCQNVELDDDEVVLRRVFSLPLRGSVEGTLHDPLVPETIDPDVALLLEVDAVR